MSKLRKLYNDFLFCLGEYFGCSRKEAKGTLLLLWVLFLAWLMPSLMNYYVNSAPKIASQTTSAQLNSQLAKFPRQTTKENKKFNINTAMQKTLIKKAKLSPAIAEAIIKYRRKLGGFVSKAQYKQIPNISPMEHDQLADSTYVKWKCLNLNTATAFQLYQHPHLTKQQAKAIIAYKKENVRFKDWTALQDRLGLAPSKLNKMKVYFRLN